MAWGICSLVLFLAALFFAFKAKQAAGRYNMNEIDIERGQGRFGTSIGSAAMNLFWFALGLIAAVGSIGTGMRALKPDTVPSSPIVEQQVVAPPEHGFLPVEAAASSVVEHAVTTTAVAPMDSKSSISETKSDTVAPEATGKSGGIPSEVVTESTASQEQGPGAVVPAIDVRTGTTNAIQVCESSPDFITRNNCRWEQCALPESKTRPECERFQRRTP